MFSNVEGRLLAHKKAGTGFKKYEKDLQQNSVLHLLQHHLSLVLLIFSQSFKHVEKCWPLPRPFPQKEGRNHRDTPIRKSLTPSPSPNGEGSDYRDTPTGWMQASCCLLLVSILAVTLCDICMPEAF